LINLFQEPVCGAWVRSTNVCDLPFGGGSGTLS
jgi:hypothetical protein